MTALVRRFGPFVKETNRNFKQLNVLGKIGVFGTILLLVVIVIPLIFELDPYVLSDFQKASLFSHSGGQFYLLGTDDLGRDLLSRLIYGAKTSIAVAVGITFFSVLLGSLLGLIAGVYRGWVDTVILRATDIMMSIPGILLAIVIVAILGASLVNAMLALIVVSIPRYIRIVRTQAITEMTKQYVHASATFAIPKYKIMIFDVLPNCLAPIIVQATLGISEAILDISALGFLGLGAKAPLPEWGTMLADARPYIETHPHLLIIPGACILFTVLSFNFLGDSLRELLNPKNRS